MLRQTFNALVIAATLVAAATGFSIAQETKPAKPVGSGMVVTLLGTGTPTINIRRFGFPTSSKRGGST